MGLITAIGQVLLLCLAPLRRSEETTGVLVLLVQFLVGLGLIAGVGALGIPFPLPLESSEQPKWISIVAYASALFALLLFIAAVRLQYRENRKNDFDEAIAQLRYSDHELEGVIANLWMVDVARNDAQFDPVKLDSLEEKYKAKGDAIIAGLVQYGTKHPLVGRRIQQQLAPPYHQNMTGREDEPYDIARFSWARDKINPIIELLSNQVIARR